MVMVQQDFQKLLLKTAFSCMACDGVIDPKEVDLIKDLATNDNLFGELNLQNEIESLTNEINTKGQDFLRNYFHILKVSDLENDEQIAIIDTALKTIKADEKIEYSEIKFFKIIRSKLKISNNEILKKMPDIEEYLEQDIISESYIERLTSDYFGKQELPQFDAITI